MSERENEREKAIFVARDKWLTAMRTCPPEAEIWKAEYERAVRAMEEYERVVPLRQAPDWTSKPTYSKWVHDHTGAETPFEQMGIYGTFLGGPLYARKSWVRANHLLLAAQLPIGSEDRKLHKALAWVNNSEIENATMVAKSFRARGILAGIGFPLLWLEYVRNKKCMAGIAQE